ncbi:IPT/TIG domain-containing protein [Flagellimonas nanhaiensis]|uniref:IPT/TIG domain-containing protein n=1 Tax=Flagellimonas nanhaiensis TaxID=2292706 RepID=A0A371JV54_9FLAO|nr:IPT/TIG domain-containing protein [Allomuricauda nanhaiensis]RDY61656.1 hypothetical protein DX873_05750 [Allomuricauda nanhaiensis]
MKKKILFGLSLLALIFYVSCGKDDDSTTTPEQEEVEITSFSPGSGEPGTEVTLIGKNFGKTASGNTVKFNGTTATVTSATATQLKTTVPNGATTGKITVTVGSSTATSSSDFTVLEPQPALQITGFQPMEGERGSSVILTGTNFSTTAGENVVKFGTVEAEVVTAKADELTVTVPDNAVSAKISVTTDGTTVTSTEEFEVFSPAKWTQVESYPNEEGRVFGVSFVIDGIIYSGLGSTSDHLTDHELWGYDTTSDSWSKKTNFPMAMDDKLTTSTSFVINKKAYIVGGNSLQNGDSSEVWEYDPNNGDGGSWTLMDAPFPGAGKQKATGFSINGLGYIVGGGFDTGEGTESVAEVWEYDPTDDSWTSKQDFIGSPFELGTSFVINNKAYIHLGMTGGSEGSSEFWQYEPAEDSWGQLASIPNERLYAFAFSVGSKGYIGYGSTYVNNQASYYEDFWEYDAEGNGGWNELMTPQGISEWVSPIAHGVDGKGFVGLGLANAQFTSELWIFEPRKKL